MRGQKLTPLRNKKKVIVKPKFKILKRRFTMKTTKLIQTLTAAAVFLVSTPAWAMEQDTGYPWYWDLPDEERQIISQPNNTSNTKMAPVLPSEEDTGYPWFADIKDDESVTKPITIFKPHLRTAGEDSGYPWHA